MNTYISVALALVVFPLVMGYVKTFFGTKDVKDIVDDFGVFQKYN